MINKGQLAAITLREEIGISDPSEIDLEEVILGRGGFVKYLPMGNTDGRIVHGKTISTVYINSNIHYEGRRRFALAHELGHLEMHKGASVHDDSTSLFWFNNMEKKLKRGIQEYEANQFASEYLMPRDLFYHEASKEPLSPELLSRLADRFQTSITSVAFKYFDLNLYPMALFHIFDGRVKYWKKSSDLRVFIKSLTKLPPPEDSVALEYIDENYEPIYKKSELRQSIKKSTWFEINYDQSDTDFYEYCIVTKAYKNILSVVWEV